MPNAAEVTSVESELICHEPAVAMPGEVIATLGENKLEPNNETAKSEVNDFKDVELMKVGGGKSLDGCQVSESSESMSSIS